MYHMLERYIKRLIYMLPEYIECEFIYYHRSAEEKKLCIKGDKWSDLVKVPAALTS